MDDRYERENDPDTVRADEDLSNDTDLRDDTEPATSHDVVEGGAIGVVGGAIVGGLAGGLAGAVIGAVAGGIASAAGVAAVDRHDHDYARTMEKEASRDTLASDTIPPVATQGDYGSQPVATQGSYGAQPVVTPPVVTPPVTTDTAVPPPSPYMGGDSRLANPELSGTYSGGAAAYDDYTGDYRNHFQMVYGATGAAYDEFEPAYRYGDRLANDSRFHTGEWDSVERFAQPDWEALHEGTWDRFKDSVRYGWDRARENFGRKPGVYRDADAKPRNTNLDVDADESDVDETRPASIG